MKIRLTLIKSHPPTDTAPTGIDQVQFWAQAEPRFSPLQRRLLNLLAAGPTEDAYFIPNTERTLESWGVIKILEWTKENQPAYIRIIAEIRALGLKVEIA